MSGAPRPTAVSHVLPFLSRPADAKQESHHREHKPREHGERRKAPVPESGPFKIFVRNLPYRATRKDVGEFFQSNCGTVQDVHLLQNKDGEMRGMGFVEFESRDALVKALEYDGKVRALAAVCLCAEKHGGGVLPAISLSCLVAGCARGLLSRSPF